MRTKKTNRDEMRKNNLSIPLMEKEKETIRNAATNCGMTMSAYARWLLLKFAKEVIENA